ncbi:hypothetical protein JF544_13150 [Halobacillus kuroshimensis]|uniref:Uncharacterized protein n=1 Tax=Halobacillus kuroshimensis TaxID=302481 RepID=A0ABS3DY06_9BACI|nr:hypothetical protein [Halobacillus kuroshimensis]MBN8236206.1 hypothetical protein [Halobacillus kuroshimensis]
MEESLFHIPAGSRHQCLFFPFFFSTQAGTARAEDPLGQATFLTKSAEGVPAVFIHQQAV